MVILTDGGVRFDGLEIESTAVNLFFAATDQGERDARARDVVELGVAVFERAGVEGESGFARRRVREALDEMHRFSEGVPALLKEAFEAAVKEVQGEVEQRFLKAAASIDPDRTDSKVAKMLEAVKRLGDPARDDSVHAILDGTVNRLFAADGALVTSLRNAVNAEVEPLRKEVRELSSSQDREKGAEETLAETTAKGFLFEERVFDEVSTYVRQLGWTAELVGGDNRPGDIVI